MVQLHKEYCKRNKIVILANDGNKIVVGLLLTTNPLIKEKLETKLKRNIAKIEYVLLSESEFMLKLSEVFQYEDTISQKKIRFISEKKEDVEISSINTNAPISTILNGILIGAKQLNASDIHFEIVNESTNVRYRIDGELTFYTQFANDIGNALSIRIKLLANLNTLEKRLPQDGRFTITYENKPYAIRTSILPTLYGESIVLRFLDTKDSGIHIESLGFSAKAERAIKNITTLPAGLVLVTGPTGSGKTTTLAAMLQLCNPHIKKVISIEDPIEYVIPHVNQVQLNQKVGLHYNEFLKRVVRQDPDVIMIGEIRDSETAEQAVRAAMTGHLVFASLHTRSILEASERLEDLGVAPFLIQQSVEAVIGQRLIKIKEEKEDTISAKSTGRNPKEEVRLESGFAGLANKSVAGRIPIVEIAIKTNGCLKKIRSFEDEVHEINGRKKNQKLWSAIKNPTFEFLEN